LLKTIQPPETVPMKITLKMIRKKKTPSSNPAWTTLIALKKFFEKMYY
jgi:hypothetical protein